MAAIHMSFVPIGLSFSQSTRYTFLHIPFLNVIENEPANRILETAVKDRAVCLVTEDKLLLKLKLYKDIKIVSVREFLEIIASQVLLIMVILNLLNGC